MILKSLFQRHKVSLLEKALNAAALRQRAIASNIANVSTPGYRRKEVKFETELQQALDANQIKIETTQPVHLSSTASSVEKIVPKVIIDQSEALSSGVNNVDIEKEMAGLAKNQIYYSVTAQLLSRKFKMLKEAITGRNY
ncbi:flagellar basal body rod protein FlgB [bacterium]|nr:flagellar basal body rod protein FlgB [bacterium]